MISCMVQLVGVLNITPDSFSDGGLFVEPEVAFKQAGKLFEDGASLVDVGAESTRPGAVPITATEEWERLEPVLKLLIVRYPDRVSVDTYHPETAERALALGDIIINDVTGMNNPAMVAVVLKHHARCIVSNLLASDPQTAHRGELIDNVQLIVDDLQAKHALLIDGGLRSDQIILDPGIGFGKTPELNRALLRFPELMPGYKVMIGYSRKRFLGENRLELEPNLAAGRIAIAAGAAFLRVHDVAGHRQLLY